MTKKAAKSNLRFNAVDHQLDEGGQHVLFERDNVGAPKRGLSGLSDVKQSDLVLTLLARINATMAYGDDQPFRPEDESAGWLEVLYELGGLTEKEARVWELRLEGHSITSIVLQIDGIKSEATVREYLRRGKAKLALWANSRKAS